MKRLLILMMAGTSLMLASCGGNNTESSGESSDSTALSPEEIQEVIEIDSISTEVQNEVEDIESSADQILEKLNKE